MSKRKRKQPDPNETSRDFCFTLNNFTQNDEKLIKQLFDNGICRYIVYGYEHILQEGKTRHLQGYCELTTGTTARPTGMHKRVPRAHFEPRYGSRNQARDYCFKECKEPVEYGVWKADYQGTRNDILAVRNEINEGKSDRYIADHHFDTWCKCRRAFARYRELILLNDDNLVHEPRRLWKTEVIVYWSYGTGTGKTRKVYEEFGYSICNMVHRNGFWSPYNSEATVLWDDFDDSCISRQEFLQLTDRYPCKLRQLGAWTEWKPRLLIITSNTNPEDWYNHDPAVLRRIDRIEEVSA